MANEFKDVDLSRNPLNIGNIDDLFLDEDLDGHLLACEGVSGQLDFPKGALPNRFPQQIVPNFLFLMLSFSHILLLLLQR